MPWITGQRLQGGKYIIDKVLGQGGFGITYKALHIELNRTVVIKTPNEYLSHDPDYDKYIERFIQEGRTLARLSQDPHPHIVGVIDLFKEGAINCLVMDFVPGENLFQVVRRRGALPEVEIVPCIRQIGEALVVVHKAGLVHRDAHPGNIMVRSNGKAVLIDFGIAKELLPKTLSSTGNAGNHGFAPYEQMTGGSREPTVDVYCLAATLYYAVTGQNPTTSLARRLHDAPLTPPKQINPSISKLLNKAILKGMALEAKDRPQSMHVWLAMLEAQKTSPSYPAKPVDRKEVVYPKPKLKSKATPGKETLKNKLSNFIGSQRFSFPLFPSHKNNGILFYLKVPKPVIKSLRIIPWGWLMGVLFICLFIGYLLGASKASVFSWACMAGAIAVAIAVAGAGAGGYWTTTIAMAGFGSANTIMVFTVVRAWSRVWSRAWDVGAIGAIGAMSWAIYVAGEKLRESFSRVDTFVILASTSSLGLGLGWLGHRIFNTGT